MLYLITVGASTLIWTSAKERNKEGIYQFDFAATFERKWFDALCTSSVSGRGQGRRNMPKRVPDRVQTVQGPGSAFGTFRLTLCQTPYLYLRPSTFKKFSATSIVDRRRIDLQEDRPRRRGLLASIARVSGQFWGSLLLEFRTSSAHQRTELRRRRGKILDRRKCSRSLPPAHSIHQYQRQSRQDWPPSS